MKRGPKPTPRLQPRQPLEVEPPDELRLRGRARQVFRQLAGRLAAEGFASMADARLVGLAAQTIEHLERLEAAVAALEDLTVTGSTGQVRPHPLLAELRSERAALAGLLDRLFLSPRSRSACRLTESQMRQAGAPDDLFERFLRGELDADGKPTGL